jgi:hypothetical protein
MIAVKRAYDSRMLEINYLWVLAVVSNFAAAARQGGRGALLQLRSDPESRSFSPQVEEIRGRVCIRGTETPYFGIVSNLFQVYNKW